MPFTKYGAEIWRDFATDGVPLSGAHKINKPDMRAWMAAVEGANAFGTGTAGHLLGTREALTASRTLYVRTDGSDSNTGLADNAGGALRNIQTAIDRAAALDTVTFNTTIVVRPGTYTQPLVLKAPVGAGALALTGDTGTPANVVISVTNNNAITASDLPRLWTISGFKIQVTTAGNAFSVARCALNYANIDFGAVPTGGSYHLYLQSGSIVTATGAYSITGSGYAHAYLESNAAWTPAARTVTLTGTPAFTTFLLATMLSVADVRGMTFSGSATGSRYLVSTNAVINTGGGGANYLPGSTAGSASGTGEYV